MIPSALTGQLEQGLADFLRFSFWSSTPGMEHVVDDLLAEPGALLKGPYVSLKLPFVTGKDPAFFPDVPLDFLPYLHQEQAFARLGGRRKLSTLIATGTGSGKTESFLLPILDHCLADAGQPGVKAILIYPMNALATDQAGRIARLIHGNDKLRGKVTAGLYIGESRKKGARGETRMGPQTVITDRATMQDAAPNILLTNYKMLDYLLLRPQDQKVWQHNTRGTLRFLVVDEIHTFDGAQGTDLACLLRRIKRRLQVDDGSLCCVGTSATLGGPTAAAHLRQYARDVFGEPFDEHSVIGESRLDDAAFLAGREKEWTAEPAEDDKDILDPARTDDPQAWLRAQERLWFGDSESTAPASPPNHHIGEDAWAVTLGERLERHATFHALLHALGGQTVDLDRLVAELARRRSAWRADPARARLALSSLLALVSAARAWRDELPRVAERRQAEGLPRPVRPFLDVRLQLWQRELARMVATVGSRPRLRHSMDLDRDARRQHLPMVHCRECGALGWAALVQRDKPHLLRTELDSFYPAYFGGDSRVCFLYPSAATPAGDAAWAQLAFRLDSATLRKLGDDEEPEGEAIELVPAPNLRSTPSGNRLSRDCPFCAARASLTLIGFRAATLTSVYIDQLFASRFNDDKKLLTFSDSVQDAAHRAGFFGSRTWRTNLRIAMLELIHERPELTLAELAQTLGPWWRQRRDLATWTATFLAPNMTWMHDWGTLKARGQLPRGSDLPALIERRLAFEVAAEFGLQAAIGRSLPRTGTATAALDEGKLEAALARLLEPLRNEVPGLRQASPEAVRFFVVGLLHHLRLRGGILTRSLPTAYVESNGHDEHAFKRDWALPGFTKTSRLPALLTDRPGSRFESWGGKRDSSWYARWPGCCFGAGQALVADPAPVYAIALPILVAAGLLAARQGKKGEQIWGLDDRALVVTPSVATMVCDRCAHRIQVAEREAQRGAGLPCLSARCAGSYSRDPAPAENYFGRLYASGDLQRIFTEEHTGMLDRVERERVEREFKARERDAGDADGRQPWFANLLSCTPTLEMGIDIGDLSSAVLCSVPPRQANYLQRIGRAGRRDGNAFVLTVAAARPHDLYFFAEPAEMFAGEVTPPGVFLDAPAVLQRQLTAFCVDRWVASRGDAADLPSMLRTVFSHLDEEGSRRFPFDLLAFIQEAQPILLREFGEMFAGAISADTAAHLRRFMTGTDDGKAGLRWTLVDTLERARRHRDSHAAKARTLRELIKKMGEAEARALDHEDELDKLEAEKEALLQLVGSINRRRTLEFLTDEGLLPNYAFPESAVRLSSVIWRKKKAAPAKGSRYESWSYEYQRSPSSALSELAPGADFYASGRRVEIDRVDLSVSKVESWRFCTECNHAQRIDLGDEATACPACNSASWRDGGQRFRLLELQQVYANAPDRESRIRDDRDDRQPRFFERQILVDIDDRHRAGAWRVDDPNLPFGFEFLKRATFREVNFGEPSDQGAKSTIAGREAVRPGFEICARCGKVQKPRKDPEHALSCPSRKEGAKQEIEPCLYLYREFASEALRLLLPMVDLGTTEQLHSFVAALQVGLEARFGGSVDHLRTTVYSEPVPGSALRKQYLVIFDTVPGGTGYLHQLITPATEGGELPLFEALELARQRIEECACWQDPDRDGCYRCLYAYRNSRDMDDTSARTASALLRRILAGKDKFEAISGLGEISISGLLDSVLEARFVEALRAIAAADGRQSKLEPKMVGNKSGYHWTLGDARWVVEPQVEPPIAETGGVPVSIDFVIRPAQAQSERRLAIFLDGWEFHRSRIGKDLRQRMAMVASGNWDVWSFTWADLDEKLSVGATKAPLELAIPDPGHLKLQLQQIGMPQAWAKLTDQTIFDWFEAEVRSDAGLPWPSLAKAVLAARMKHAAVKEREAWKRFVERVAPPVARQQLSALVPHFVAADLAEINPYFELMAVFDGEEPALLCTLDDREELHEAPDLKAAWQGYLRLFQLLRHAPNAWFMTRTGSEAGADYTAIARMRDGTPSDCAWDALEEIDPPYRTLADQLIAVGAREPEIGIEVPDRRGKTWSEAELVWESERVAITSRHDTRLAIGQPDPTWTVFLLEDLADDPASIIDALRTEES